MKLCVIAFARKNTLNLYGESKITRIETRCQLLTQNHCQNLYGESKITRIETSIALTHLAAVENLYGESKITRIETLLFIPLNFFLNIFIWRIQDNKD